jgi:hypothetical protein
MSGAVSPLPNTPSWRGVEFKKGTRTTLPLPLTSVLMQNTETAMASLKSHYEVSF